MTAITILRWSIPFFFCLLLAGCAGFQVRTEVVSGPEATAAAAALQKMAGEHDRCRCFEAEVTVNLAFSSWGGDRIASLPGYLQTMAPASLKFVGVNPFGQPQLIVAVNNKRFRTVLVPEAKVFTGAVGAKTYAKYAPPGFNPGDLFAWLAGRAGLGDGVILSIREGETAGTYWFELERSAETGRVHLLFDPRVGVILRCVVSDRDDKILVDVSYGDFKNIGDCRLPGKMHIESPTQHDRLDLVLSDILPCKELSAAVFDLLPPPGFENIVVE
jgi:hypothetical protein